MYRRGANDISARQDPKLYVSPAAELLSSRNGTTFECARYRLGPTTSSIAWHDHDKTHRPGHSLHGAGVDRNQRCELALGKGASNTQLLSQLRDQWLTDVDHSGRTVLCGTILPESACHREMQDTNDLPLQRTCLGPRQGQGVRDTGLP